MANTTAERYLTVAEVAALFSVSEATIRRWIRRGMLPASKVGDIQSVRVRESDARSLLKPLRD